MSKVYRNQERYLEYAEKPAGIPHLESDLGNRTPSTRMLNNMSLDKIIEIPEQKIELKKSPPGIFICLATPGNYLFSLFYISGSMT